ncbi:MAG TPA: cobalamin B12-binding domain-containing protein [Candidatus Binataceae bacterium]|nr:cobalamin B12-binding domain-containing protein [Candidatus Binataceae bacterium]
MERSAIRVMVAKPGLDGHDRGAKIIAYALRDAGMEVVYTGLRHSPEEIVNAAVQEDVEAVGLSILSGAHLPLTEKVMAGLAAVGRENEIAVFVGGTIPEADVDTLKKMGVAGVFPTGTPLSEIVPAIRGAVEARRSAAN